MKAMVDTIEQVKEVVAILSIGSNCGDRYSNVSEGIVWLSKILSGIRSSTIYATPDCHGGNREYLNAVVAGKTHNTPEEINNLCKEFEKSCGRNESMRQIGYVPVDIDLVIYDDTILRPNDFKRDFFKIGYGMI